MRLHLVEQESTFDQFWRMYPLKRAKSVALQVWQRLSFEDRAAALAALPSHIDEWRDRGDPRFIPHARTWLYQRRWEDELELALEIKPCRWAGCKKNGTVVRGHGQYCDQHIAALNRGETP